MSTQSIDNTILSAIDSAAKALGSVAELAQAIGVADSAPSMWKSRGSVPPQHCAAIEAATNRLVMRWQLRPGDWHRIWPELIGAPGAPRLVAVRSAEPPSPAVDHAEAHGGHSDAEQRNAEQARMLKRALIKRDGPSNVRER